MNLATLREWAYAHPDHLGLGLCPDTHMKDSRDPDCCYCAVMDVIDVALSYRDAVVSSGEASYRRKEPDS